MNKQQQSNAPYIIGTRGSLLALTQCTQVKKQLESLTGASFELKIIKTQGDMDTSVPLWQMEGKDFFTKELDEALLKKEVDLVVHSYKDLGSDRPDGIKLASITKRNFCHDVLLMSSKSIQELQNSTIDEVTIGTSSPRRIYNIEKSLSQFLPGHPKKVKTKQLRGNVNTRVKKLVNGDYDGIVLALAGLERLAQDKKAQEEILPLLENLNYCVLPTSKFPSAASQGALAIECLESRDDKGALLNLLKQVHDSETQQCVEIERDLFQRFGGGCHLAVGINCRPTKGQMITSTQGIHDKTPVSSLNLSIKRSEITGTKKVFIGVPLEEKENLFGDQLVLKSAIDNKSQLNNNSPIYVTTKYAHYNYSNSENNSLWCAGTKTWRHLTSQNLWVNGCADSYGEDELKSFKDSKFLQLFNDNLNGPWQVLSHHEGKTDLGNIIPSYQRSLNNQISEEWSQNITECDIFYWTSYKQYEIYTDKFPNIKNALHCCGVGKTYEAFQDNDVEATPFTGMLEFKSWAKLD